MGQVPHMDRHSAQRTGKRIYAFAFLAGLMNVEPALKELRNEIRRMDEVELLAFRRQYRANSDSVEYQEAQVAWLRKAEKRRARELEHRQTLPSVKSSWALRQGNESAEISASDLLGRVQIRSVNGSNARLL
jgi:hypothetical protein